jgi:SNF2 family DNA or RNA helicase
VHQQQFTIARALLPSLRKQFAMDKESSMATLNLKRGEMIYLMSLERSHDTEERDAGAETGRSTSKLQQSCPICLMEMKGSEAFFTCGHSFCGDCVTVLIRRATNNFSKSLHCPSCRRVSMIDGINFAARRALSQCPRLEGAGETTPTGLSAGEKRAGADVRCAVKPRMSETLELALGAEVKHVGDAPHVTSTPFLFPGEVESILDDKNMVVLGSQASKIGAVVRVVKAIALNDPSAKILVFSQWTEVLHIVANALRENNVNFGSMMGVNFGARTKNNSAPAVLEDFKRSTSRNVLLLPLRRGATGLNIVEATHVVLVEPSLNPAAEAQAVSRVHRMSQTKPTFVHRFIVNNTIEDKVRKIAQGRKGLPGSKMANETVSDNEVIAIFDDNS